MHIRTVKRLYKEVPDHTVIQYYSHPVSNIPTVLWTSQFRYSHSPPLLPHCLSLNTPYTNLVNISTHSYLA